METRFQKFIKPIIITSIIIFGICWLTKKPENVDDFCSYIGYAISGVTVLFILYERVLWKAIPWNSPPILKPHYNGKITFVQKKETMSKEIDVTVKQSLFSIRIITKTDINSSNSVVGSIVNENGESVLYYSYITNPSAITQGKNPVQYGTCRMVLINKCETVKGKYWTTSQTLGDIEWTASEKV